MFKQVFFYSFLIITSFLTTAQNKINEGDYKAFDDSTGKLISIKRYHQGLLNGISTIYHLEGDSICMLYINGIKQYEKYWSRNGKLLLDINYRYRGIDSISSYTNWSSLNPNILISQNLYINGIPVGYYRENYENGGIKYEGFYSKDTLNMAFDRKSYFIFLDDYYANGFTTISDSLGVRISNEILADRFYENGNIKSKIISTQKDSFRGQVINYSQNAKIVSICNIKYGLLTKKEMCEINKRNSQKTIINDILSDIYCNEQNCWYLDGKSYYFNSEEILVETKQYIKGLLIKM